MVQPTKEILTLDGLLELGGHQVWIYVITGLAGLVMNPSSLSFMFTTAQLRYRCYIPECENLSNTTYLTNWVHNAVPFDLEGYPKTCERYAMKAEHGGCDSEAFDKSKLVDCSTWVFETDEVNLLNEFNLECDKNKWKLSLIGSIAGFGALVGSPLCAFISDKFGRKRALCWFGFPFIILGFIRSFSVSYHMYAILDFLNTFLGYGIYETAFVLCMELVSFRHRVVANVVFNTFCSMGYVVMGILGYFIHDWHWLLRAIYIPGTILFFYNWLLPESMRWLLIHNRIPEAANVVKDVIKRNPQAKDIDIIQVLVHTKQTDTDVKHMTYLETLHLTCKSSKLLLRIIHASFIWMGSVLLLYGLLQQSVGMSGDKHLNWIYSALAQIFGISSSVVSKKIGYKFTTVFSLCVCAVCSMTFYFIPHENVTLRFSVYLISKSFVTSAYATLFLSTVSLFPTPLRQSLLAFCYMIGRVGQILAPQLVLLSADMPPLIFGVVAMTVASLAFFVPETFHLELPDTVQQAEDVEGKDSAELVERNEETS